MRQIRSSGSVKAISLDRSELIRRLREVAKEALNVFPELEEVRLIGSLASGTHTGLSDIDLFLRLRKVSGDPLDSAKPYYFFFSQRLDIGLDVLLAGPEVPARMREMLQGSILLAARREADHQG